MHKFCKTFAIYLCIALFFFVPFVSSFADTNNPLTASVTVPPSGSDFSFIFNSPNEGSTVNQDSVINYQMVYKVLGGTSVPVTLTADWSSAFSQDGVLLVDYVSDSASTGYGGVAPVIDLLHHTISWTIPSVPGHTDDQIVEFSLKVNHEYHAISPVLFTVGASLSSLGTTLTQQNTKTYLFRFPIGGDGRSSSPQPAPYIPDNDITRVSITSVTSTTAHIIIGTRLPSLVTLIYGTSPDHLTKKLVSSIHTLYTGFTLSQLSPDTRYYLQAATINNKKQEIHSSLYTFTTAQKEEQIEASLQNLTITSQDHTLFSGLPSDQPFILLPQQTSYGVGVRFSHPELIQDITLRLLMSDGSEIPVQNVVSSTTTGMYRVSASLFSSTLSSQLPGTYSLHLSAMTKNGTILEVPLFTQKIFHDISVVEEKTGKPIENARVLISGQQFLFPPLWSNTKGEARPFLFQGGEYQIRVLALGYKEKTVSVTLGKGPTEDFQTIYLEKEGVNLFTLFSYYSSSFLDFWHMILSYIASIAQSTRFFDLISFGILSLFSLTTLFALIVRTKLHLHHVAPLLLAAFPFSKQRLMRHFIQGVVIEQETGKPLVSAHVFLFASKHEGMLATTKTNASGMFFIKKSLDLETHTLMAIKNGYKPSGFFAYSKEELIKEPVILSLSSYATHHSLLQFIIRFIEQIMSACFELLLLLSIILECVFIPTIGLLHVLPFLLLSGATGVIWIAYLRSK